MKKWLSIALALTLCLGLCSSAFAATLKTTSTFAGTDPAAELYLEIIKEWEAETGNTVNDSSATSDEAWKAGVLNDFAAGNEADVLFYFANTADSKPILDRVVPISEINEAYPELKLVENELLREADGNVYAIPVRSFWEGMFVNKDLFEEYDLELPTDWEKLKTAIATFKENGIVPISLSLSDIPHYIVEFAILASGTPEDHMARPKTVEEMPESWVLGHEMIHELYELGAFSEDVNATNDALMEQLFRDKGAAMRVDGSWFANGITQENWDTTIAMPFPAYQDSADPTATIGGTSMGFYITRKAWDDPEKRDAAVSFLAKMTSDESVEKLGFFFGGDLLKSAKDMVAGAKALCGPIGDVIDLEVRNYWFSMVPSIADGSADAREVMEEVITRGGF